MRVGFVGLGVMGKSMAQNLLRRGHEVTVYNRTAERCAPLHDAGARVAASPREAVQAADICVVIVTDDAAVRAVAEGPDGVLAGIRKGATIADMSTISPATTRELGALAEKAGATWLDAPVTGGDIGAREGTLTIMVGGDKEVFARALPVFEAMGKKIVHVGELGQGQTMKLVGNFISGMTLMVAAEGLRLGLHAGLSRDMMEQVLPFSSAQSFELTKLFDRLKTRHFEPGFSLANRTKDLRLAVAMAKELDFPQALSDLALRLLSEVTESDPDRDESAYLMRFGTLAE